MKEEKIGFTIGKFAPLHKGHQYLIETALKEVDKFIVIVYETHLTKVPTEVRANWIKTIYPNVDVRIALNPQGKYGLDKESVEIQMKYLLGIIPDVIPTHFYSSEPYGKAVSEYLNIVNRQVDNGRKAENISAGIIRNNLEENRKWIEDMVYKDCRRYEK